MTRRDRIHQILKDAAGRSAPVMNEYAILDAAHKAGDLDINLNSLRMILRGLGQRVRCVVNGPKGNAKWEAAKAST